MFFLPTELSRSNKDNSATKANAAIVVTRGQAGLKWEGDMLADLFCISLPTTVVSRRKKLSQHP
jgi:hypothetical protein